ncbi:MAG: aa3-type cytochrome c oxidase subunit IV [Parvibaculaceae bacterium]
MAEHTVDHHLDISAHRATYANFVRGSVALGLICAFVLVALCSFAFGHTLNVFTGFAGLIIGVIAVLIDARSGSQRWFLATGVLVIFGLLTAVSVS